MRDGRTRPTGGPRNTDWTMRMAAAMVVAVTAVVVMALAALAHARADVAVWTLAGAALFLAIIFVPRRGG